VSFLLQYTNEENIFPCCKLINKGDAKITFYPIKSEAFVFPCVFNTLREQDITVDLGTIPNQLFPYLEKIHERHPVAILHL
jgi:hypothetical protein